VYRIEDAAILCWGEGWFEPAVMSPDANYGSLIAVRSAAGVDR
jgi:hypothetical protein